MVVIRRTPPTSWGLWRLKLNPAFSECPRRLNMIDSPAVLPLLEHDLEEGQGFCPLCSPLNPRHRIVSSTGALTDLRIKQTMTIHREDTYLKRKCREPRELLARKPNADLENGREGFLELS